MNQKLSMIVAVYNVEDFLVECLESIAKQDYPFLEVLLIDDGSTDSSGLICNRFASCDSRFLYFRKRNGGLSDARNYGITHASGEYICFIDGDDLIEAQYSSKLISAVVSTGCDIATCCFKKFAGNADAIRDLSECPSSSDVEITTGLEALKRFLIKQSPIDVVAWNKIYKIELFDDIRYPLEKVHEDVFTTYKLLFEARMVAYLEMPLYLYRQRAGSIMHGSPSKRLQVLEAIEEVKEFATNKGLVLDEEIAAFSILLKYSALSQIIKAKQLQEYKSVYHKISEEIKNTRYIRNTFISLNMKARIVLLLTFPRWFRLISQVLKS